MIYFYFITNWNYTVKSKKFDRSISCTQGENMRLSIAYFKKPEFVMCNVIEHNALGLGNFIIKSNIILDRNSV